MELKFHIFAECYLDNTLFITTYCTGVCGEFQMVIFFSNTDCVASGPL